MVIASYLAEVRLVSAVDGGGRGERGPRPKSSETLAGDVKASLARPAGLGL